MAAPRPNLVILLLIGVAAVALAAVQVPSGVTPPTTTTIPPLRTVALPQATDQIDADFQETFVALATDGDPALLVVEPGSTSAEAHPLHWDVAWSLELDEGASWLATLPVRGHPGRLVIRPVRGGTEIDRTGVTSFAWHTTDPGLLAWVEEEHLYAWDTSSSTLPELIRPLPAGMELDGWGDWGFTMREGDGLAALDRGGDLRGRLFGHRLVSAGPTGTILTARGPHLYIGDQSLDIGPALGPRPLVAGWSPGGDQFAGVISGGPVLELVIGDTQGSASRRFPIGDAVSEIAALDWASDRFVVFAIAAREEVAVVDLEEAVISTFPLDRRVHGLWVRR